MDEMKGQKHEDCGGVFQEMSLYDDWEGKVTCSGCGVRTKNDLRPNVKITEDLC